MLSRWLYGDNKVIQFNSLSVSEHLYQNPSNIYFPLIFNVRNRIYIIIAVFPVWYLHISGDYEAAISEHQQELALSEVLKDVIGRAVASRKIGECYAEMGNIEAALKVSRFVCFAGNSFTAILKALHISMIVIQV